MTKPKKTIEFKHVDLKGVFNGNCNREACQSPGATFYNFSTERYYCQSCARLINDANRTQAMELYGHDLCLTKEQIEGLKDG